MGDEEFMQGMALTRPEQDLSRTIGLLAQSMRAVMSARMAGDDPDDPEPYGESPKELHDEVRGDFIYIKNVLTPRVLALADDPVLAGLLLELEDHEEEWQAWLTTSEEWGAPESFAWREATAAIEVASKIFAGLVEHDRAALGVGSDPAENLPH